MKQLILALVLAPVVALASCAPLAIITTTILVTDEWKENALTADVTDEVDVVWASVRQSMANLTDALLHVDEDHRAIQTRVDNAVVVVHVMQWDNDETRIYVEAQKYMLHNPEIAQLVMKRLVDDLQD